MDIHLTEAEKIKVLTSDDIYKIMQTILLREQKIDQNKEHFWIIGLANNLNLLFVELIGLGTVNKVLVNPMEVFSFALQKRAVKIMLCHNHPSGELQPSKDDKDTTDRMIQVGKIVGTPVLDHLIITERSYLSFNDVGLMEQLEQSTKYIPPYQLVEKIRKEAVAFGRREERVEIAKELKRRDMPLEAIAEITGLTIEEIKALRVRRKK
ncbi:MAG: JAB domain-containing protein [Aureispira sp.]